MRFRRAMLTAGVAAAGVAAIRRIQHKPYQFYGSVVLITGGSRGLGLVLARQLAREGAQIALVARDADELERAAADVRSFGTRVMTIPCDVRNQAECNATIQHVIDTFGRVDVLVNNAGIIQAAPLAHVTQQDFEDTMNTHFWGAFYMCNAALQHMRKQGGGRIVNIASIGGRVAIPHLLPYSTSKFALVGFSDGLRDEVAKEGIVVTTVCPGLLRTGSPYNAMFKGQHEREFAWFAIFDSLPFTSVDAEYAAQRIIAACSNGAAHLTISPQAKLLGAMNALMPGLVSTTLQLTDRFLPGPTDARGDVEKTGQESRSPIAPSFLTRLSDEAAVQNNELGS